MIASEMVRYQDRQETCADFGLHPFAGTFRNADLEHAFLLHHLVQTQTQLRITLSFCASFYVAFALSDVAALGYNDKALVLLFARLLVAVTAAACIAVIARRPQSIAATRVAATAVEIVGMGAFMLITWYRPGELPWHAMSMSIMLIVVYLFIPNAFVNAMSVALATTVAFSVLSLHIGGLKISDVITMVMLLMLVNAFGIVAARRYERLWRHEFRAQMILRNLGFRDHLTGCYNRRYLEDLLLGQEIERANRYPAWLTVIMCDLDHFKAINDNHGHQVGDAVLQYFAILLQATCREHVDSVIRYGGEEFLLILPETDLDGGVRLGERLRAALADLPVCYDGRQTLKVTASFGVVAVDFSETGHGVSPQSLISRADELLYRAKNGGRNRVEFAEFRRHAKVR